MLLVDDSPEIRDSFRAFFSHQRDFELCGEARNGVEGVELYGAQRPDIVLMDLQLPLLSGVDATRQICQRWPEACVVALTTFGSTDYVVAALRAGASGYLLKEVGGRGLLLGMRQALAGEMPLSSAIRHELVTTIVAAPSGAQAGPGHTLTTREVEVLQRLALGLTNQEIAAQMYVSEGSVKAYLSHIGDKLGVKSRTGILIRAIQLNIVDPYAGLADLSVE